jgi:hypothetical protein
LFDLNFIYFPLRFPSHPINGLQTNGRAKEKFANTVLLPPLLARRTTPILFAALEIHASNHFQFSSNPKQNTTISP